MRIFSAFLLATALVCLFGCGRDNNRQPGSSSSEISVNQKADPQMAQESDAPSELSNAVMTTIGSRPEQIKAQAAQMQASMSAFDRKIIRNGELSIEIDSPTDGLSRITAIAESLGGFIVTSEMKQNGGRNQSNTNQSVTVVARVPSSQFEAAMERIRNIGSHVLQQKISGQDVTEEYLDLEAQIRTKKALEAQFLEIMKQAKKVSEALEVQNELASVRTAIEQLEGRRRFLENQSAFSTITSTLQMPAPVVTATTTGFGHSIKEALGDGVDTAASILLGLIRLFIVLIPVALFIGLPMWFIWRVVRRRLPKKPEPVAEV
ncbi:MAG: DUF4349 domain-containing protein [Blastocatellia bacterium]